MYVQITNYQFKGGAEKAKGLEYIKNFVVPAEQEKFGFISSTLTEGGENDLFLMMRYTVKENSSGNNLDREKFKNEFSSLWSATPVVIGGPNKISKEFQNLAESIAGK